MFPDVARTSVAPEVISTYTSEGQFTGLAVDLLREASSYVCIASCVMGENPTWERDQAIVGGHAVRLFKLLTAFLDQVCQHRRETPDILARLVFETAVNARYLVQEWDAELAESYVRFSFRHERKLFDTINGNIAKRGGGVLPIEDRMLRSLKRSAHSANVSLEDIDRSEKAPWGNQNLARKAKMVGWQEAYDAVFGGLSHNVHGGWQDLYTHHLAVTDDGRFTPQLEWSRPRPQTILVLSIIAIQAVTDVTMMLGGEKALAQLSGPIDDLHARIVLADDAHELFLQGRGGPTIP